MKKQVVNAAAEIREILERHGPNTTAEAIRNQLDDPDVSPSYVCRVRSKWLKAQSSPKRTATKIIAARRKAAALAKTAKEHKTFAATLSDEDDVVVERSPTVGEICEAIKDLKPTLAKHSWPVVRKAVELIEASLDTVRRLGW